MTTNRQQTAGSGALQVRYLTAVGLSHGGMGCDRRDCGAANPDLDGCGLHKGAMPA